MACVGCDRAVTVVGAARFRGVLSTTGGGLLGRLFFSRKRVGSDGTLRFRDNGEWSTYVGPVDSNGSAADGGR